ncbi:MAG: S8 family serine peptidase [Acidobacteria bacterium]|nr:S8 family serine peptidase [Acidobacteriota bacterium]
MRTPSLLSAVLWLLLAPRAQGEFKHRLERYAIVLDAAPLAEQNDIHKDVQIRAAQQTLRAAVEQRGGRVINSTRLLVNALYVLATEEQAAELARLDGVRAVEPMRRLRLSLNKAAELVNAQGGWNVVGGPDRAGQGVKIGILDSGIDQNHPAFQDTSLSVPAGFPKCRGEDCAYTNRKVIAARSYVDLLVIGEEPEISRPDDTSPRDRVGHGTAAAMVAAGRLVQGPAAAIRGIASGAWLANYKIFGSPGVNDATFDDVVITALEDAVIDGMDIVSLSFSGPALWGPNDRGVTCGLPGTRPCDLLVDAIENAIKLGLTVVTVAGNDGDLGYRLPTLNSIHSPGTSPGAITVGASTNGQAFYAGVLVEDNDVPAAQRRMSALFGDGPKPGQPLRAPLRDVSKLEDNGRACSPLTSGSLTGAIALIERGDCSFPVKVNNAHNAGAIGVILFNQGSNGVFRMQGLAETGIPAVLIGADNGQTLKRFLERLPGRPVALDPALQAVQAEPDIIAYFSSQGPSAGESAIKPDVTAVGTDLYMATQKYDPNGELYDPSGYTAAQGTSFAAPMVAGAAAIARQRNPRLRPGQLKSLVVNTAVDLLDDFDYDDRLVPARWTGGGNGLLNVRDVLLANVTIEPATISFGAITTPPYPVRTLTFTNLTNNSLSLQFEVLRRDQDRNLSIALTPSSLAVPANSSRELQVRLSGSLPQPGSYEGEIRVAGASIPLRIPFLYLVTDSAPFNIFPLRGFDFTGVVHEPLPGRLTFKVVDRYGLPVPDVSVRFGATLGGGQTDRPTLRTDELGIAEARAILGPQLGDQEFAAEAGGLTVYFPGRARLRPLIESNGVVNRASLRVGSGLAPGSYISILGRGLSDVARTFSTSYLPVSLAGVSVSFDVPARRLSLPGRLYWVSENLVTVQIPWELQGLNSAQMKVSIGDFSSALYDVPLSDYSPAAFEYIEEGSGRLLVHARDEASQLVGTTNPARRGRTIQISANGLGPVENQPPTGEPSPVALARTKVEPQLTIGSRPAQVLSSGLAPQAIGLYRIEAVVPQDAPTGLQPLAITVNGITGKTVTLPVQ